jgi:hypothetical protein
MACRVPGNIEADHDHTRKPALPPARLAAEPPPLMRALTYKI